MSVEYAIIHKYHLGLQNGIEIEFWQTPPSTKYEPKPSVALTKLNVPSEDTTCHKLMSLPENKWAVFLRGEMDLKLKRFEQANHAVVRELPPLTRCIVNPIDNRLGGSPMFLPHQNKGKKPPRLLFDITLDVITAIHDPGLDQYEPKARNTRTLASQVAAIVGYIFYEQCGVPSSREPNWEDVYKAGFRFINYPAQLPFPWDARMFEGPPFSTVEAMVLIVKQFAHEDPLRRLGVVNRCHGEYFSQRRP
ncbi:hypothetical protein FRC02_010554 [Tulasnella sp. 418]|nr:hypothetical protein FRC02_010554 [Tulasnella sp. 418]